MAARIRQSLAEAKTLDNVIVAFELRATARAPWGLCLEVLDVAVRCGVSRVQVYGVELPRKDADLRKLVRKLKEPSAKSRTSFVIRFGGKPLNGTDKRVPIPISKRVRGAYAGFYKPGHVEVEWEEEEAEDEPEELEEEELEEEEIPELEYDEEDIAFSEISREGAGLTWLAGLQRDDGTWTGSTATTALATMAFLRADNKRHELTTCKALDALAAQATRNVRDRAYAAMALSVAQSMAPEARFRKVAQARLDKIGDVPTLLVLQALLVGRAHGLEIDGKRIEKMAKSLARGSDNRARFAKAVLNPTVEEIRRAIPFESRVAASAKPRGWLNGTWTMALLGGDDWKEWRRGLRRVLRTQDEDGSWDGDVTKTATMVLCAIAARSGKPILKSERAD